MSLLGSWGSRSHSSHTVQCFSAVVYSPGQGEDDEAARAAGSRLFLFCCLCVGGGGCPDTEPHGSVRSCRCSAPMLGSVMSAVLGEPSSTCCRLITSRSGSWRGLFQATEQSFPAAGEAVPPRPLESPNGSGRCVALCTSPASSTRLELREGCVILLGSSCHGQGMSVRAHLRLRGGSAAHPELSWALWQGGRQRGAPAPPQLHNSSVAA